MAEADPPFRPTRTSNRSGRHLTRARASPTFVYTAKTGSTNADASAVLGDAESPVRRSSRRSRSPGTAARGRSLDRPAGHGAALHDDPPAHHPRERPLGRSVLGRRCASPTGSAARASVNVDLHWPNDLFVRDRKLGGILCISRVSGDVAHVAAASESTSLRPAGRRAAIEPPPGSSPTWRARVSRELVLAEILLAFDRRLPALTLARDDRRHECERAAAPGRALPHAHGHRRCSSYEDGARDRPGRRLRLDVDGTERRSRSPTRACSLAAFDRLSMTGASCAFRRLRRSATTCCRCRRSSSNSTSHSARCSSV